MFSFFHTRKIPFSKLTIIPFFTYFTLAVKKKMYCAIRKTTNVDDSLDSIEQKINDLTQMKYRNCYSNITKSFPNIKNPVLKEILDRSLYSRLKYQQTFTPTIDEIIQPGLDNPEFENCIISPNAKAYSTFYTLFLHFLKFLLPKEDFTKQFENESYPLVKSMIMGSQNFMQKYLIDIDLQTNRNIDGYSFTPNITRSERKEITQLVTKFIYQVETIVFHSNGKFLQIADDKTFVEHSDNKNLKSAGVFRDWPDDRIVYANGNFMCYINEEDHIKLKMKVKNNPKACEEILRYFEFLEKMEKNLHFAYHPYLGYLATVPSNVGTGTYFTLTFSITGEKEKQLAIKKKLDECAKDFIYEISKKEVRDHDEYYLEIQSRNPFYTFSTFLVDILSIKDQFK